jgi:hypothetical protein
MKALIHSSLALLLMVVSSCNHRNYSFETRKYRPGLYAHKAHKDQVNQTVIAKATDVPMAEIKTNSESISANEPAEKPAIINSSIENTPKEIPATALSEELKSKNESKHARLNPINFSNLSFQDMGSHIKSLKAVRKELKKDQKKKGDLDTYEILRICYYVVLGVSFSLIIAGAIVISRLDDTPLGLLLMGIGGIFAIGSVVLYIIAKSMY